MSHNINFKLILNYKCFKQDIAALQHYEDEEKYSTKGVDLAFKQIVVIMSWKMFYFKPKVYLLNRI